MKPTEKQIKEFWKACDLTCQKDRDGTLTWYNPEGDFVDFGYPDIDFNNLFKYAVPKLGYWLISAEKNKQVGAVVQYLDNSATVMDKDPTLALFWALYEVMNER